jgi:hypothetical protein
MQWEWQWWAAILWLLANLVTLFWHLYLLFFGPRGEDD